MPERFDPFESPLQHGELIKRYKRFLADIRLDDGSVVTAHCPNSGSMLGMREPGSEVLVRHVPDPGRKLKWTWELVKPLDADCWVGCNTQRPNQVAEWAITRGVVPGLSAAVGLRREVPYGKNSRIDLLLGGEGSRLTYVEVKNTTLARDDLALFPDAVTARGTKHMDELAAMVGAGHRAVVLFFVNRADTMRFDVAWDIDPTYGAAFDRALDAGVEALPLGMDVAADGWRVRGVLPYVPG